MCMGMQHSKETPGRGPGRRASSASRCAAAVHTVWDHEAGMPPKGNYGGHLGPWVT